MKEIEGMKQHIFSTIILSNGSKCDILEVRPYIIWKASYKQALNPNLKLDLVPFIMEQIVIIDGKKRDMKFIGNMEINDYLEITEVMNACMNKLPGF